MHRKRWASILVTRHVGQHLGSVILEKELSLKAASVLEAIVLSTGPGLPQVKVVRIECRRPGTAQIL